MSLLAVIASFTLLLLVIAAVYLVVRPSAAGNPGRSRALTEYLPAAVFGVLCWMALTIAMRMPVYELRWLPVIVGIVAFGLAIVGIKLWWHGRDDKLRFGLRTLLALPVVVSALLGASLLLHEWRVHRPPYKQYSGEQYDVVYETFIGHIREGELDAAYDVTSDRFKQHMSREEFLDLFRRYPEILGGEANRLVEVAGDGPPSGDSVPLQNCARRRLVYQPLTPGSRHVGLWIWVVMRDSLYQRHPPTPQVEEIVVQEFDSWPNLMQWPEPTWQTW